MNFSETVDFEKKSADKKKAWTISQGGKELTGPMYMVLDKMHF